jgi:hypothetical protein
VINTVFDGATAYRRTVACTRDNTVVASDAPKTKVSAQTFTPFISKFKVQIYSPNFLKTDDFCGKSLQSHSDAEI